MCDSLATSDTRWVIVAAAIDLYRVEAVGWEALGSADHAFGSRVLHATTQVSAVFPKPELREPCSLIA
jgi:hypothetical protein